MKIFKLGNLCLLASTVTFTACLERQFEEAEGLISVDTKEIIVPADMYEGRNLVKDTLYITSNRSWSAELTEDVDWVTMDTTGHQDMARVSEITPLALSFKDNETDEERSATIRIYGPDGQKDITIRQEPISYRLELVSGTVGFGSVKSDGDTLGIRINSNTDWTIKVKGGSDAKVTFDKSSGKYTSSISATVAENEDLFTKNAMLIISAKNCKDIEIPVVQLEGFPYFRIASENGETVFTADEGISNFDIPIKTNTTWRCELVSAEGYAEGTVLPPLGTGAKTAAKALITFPATINFGGKGEIKLKFIADGVEEPAYATITQDPAIRLLFGNHASTMYEAGASIGMSASTWPFKKVVDGSGTEHVTDVYTYIPSSKSLGVMKNEVTKWTLYTGHEIEIYSTVGFWKNSKSGFMCHGAVGDYFTLPVIEGKKLVKMFYCFRNTSSYRGDIQDASGKILEDSSFTFTGQGTTYTIEPKGAQPGVQYRIVAGATGQMQLGEMILYYE